jgi:hypothetical protein
VGYNAIDPDGVLAMSVGTLNAATSVGEIGREIRTQTSSVEHLVPGPPDAGGRTETEAQALSTLAGYAKDHALKYVDDVKPLKELSQAGYWLPDLSNLGWDPTKTVMENVTKTARSDEFGAFVLGTSGGLLERYRNWKITVPAVDTKAGRAAAARLSDLVTQAPDDIVRGTPVIRRASGLLVPQGSTGDPRIPKIAAAADDAGMYRPGPGMVTDAKLGRPPTWARTGGRALGVIGAGLTVYDSFATQWEEDGKYHPEWSTGQRVASASYNAATEGGGAVAGGLVGAQIGATVGSFIPIPVVGTVGGAIVGGAIGAFVGSKAGKAVGTLLKEGGEAVVDGAKKVWNSIFG